MAISTMPPTTSLHPLHRASGSATYTSPTSPTSTADPPISILATAHLPLEASRRTDELPESATIDVHIRPAHNSTGTPRERRLEGVLAGLLRRVVLVENFPRSVVRVTLQILSGEEEEEGTVDSKVGRHAARDVRLLPALVNASMLALVDAAAPLAGVCVAAVGSVDAAGGIGVGGKAACRSLHAMAFTARGQLVLEESVGDFGIEEWEKVREVLREECVGALTSDEGGEDGNMDGAERTPWFRKAVEEKIRSAGAWREDG